MRASAWKLVKRGALLVAVILVTLLVGRAWQSQEGAPLALWHTYIPDELSASDIAVSDWIRYVSRENALFDDVRAHVTQALPEDDRLPSNRYYEGSPIYPGRFATDWNRSYVLEPAGVPRGAVVLLHGLTDSPYSLRHVARRYQQDGFVAIAIRLPGHGTVPAGLVDVEWEAWSQAARLAVREARRRAGPNVPLHIVGFSNGGALAMKYALDALDDQALARPDRIVLFSPMIGVTSLARFAGLFGLPALLPRFAKASWLGVVPEFNPFKYNSFPVNGARQSSLLTRALQQRLAAAASAGELARLAPVLTFQSVVDFTVSTRAIVDALYGRLPANGSELVLFDLNRTATFGPLLPMSADTLLNRQVPPPPRTYTLTIVTNRTQDSAQVVARTTPAQTIDEHTVELGVAYPREIFSLSHLALPFPMDDSLYGMQPDGREDYGVHLGAIAARGERGLLVVSMDSLLRMTSNPFFPYVAARIDDVAGRTPSK